MPPLVFILGNTLTDHVFIDFFVNLTKEARVIWKVEILLVTVLPLLLILHGMESTDPERWNASELKKLESIASPVRDDWVCSKCWCHCSWCPTSRHNTNAGHQKLSVIIGWNGVKHWKGRSTAVRDSMSNLKSWWTHNGPIEAMFRNNISLKILLRTWRKCAKIQRQSKVLVRLQGSVDS